MGAKGEHKKEMILKAAEELFVEKGFSSVTMQDICNKMGISRGGLYRYYPSTAEIFINIINKEQENALAQLKRANANNIPAIKIMNVFLLDRFNRFSDRRYNLENAMSDFAAKYPDGKKVLQERADRAIQIVSSIIIKGVEEGDMKCNDPESTAITIMSILEGLAKHHDLLPLHTDEILRQRHFILNMVTK
ncbi:MAG: TetR/AcrR family transcriptional regulator [Parasporobacterium sp.]|nr:TetR/AcrR family transcriptional regulator [Parasporobacterium sp.]